MKMFSFIDELPFSSFFPKIIQAWDTYLMVSFLELLVLCPSSVWYVMQVG